MGGSWYGDTVIRRKIVAKFLKNKRGKVLFRLCFFRTFAMSKDEAAEAAFKGRNCEI